ncbi:MAG: type I secretion system permease/ATPase, partial [Ideonella sp.]
MSNAPASTPLVITPAAAAGPQKVTATVTIEPPQAAPVRATPVVTGVSRLREDLIHADPLLDCLVEVCRLHGSAATRASLSAGLPLGTGRASRLTLELVERAAARASMAAKLQRIELAKIDAATLPVILVLADNQACVLLGWENDGQIAKLLLPETGQGSITLTRDELEARYIGVTLFVRPHFRFDMRTPVVRKIKAQHWFWSAVLEQRGVYRDVMWAALLINFFALATPLFSMNVYDRVVPNNAVETLWALSIGVILIIGADLFMRTLRSHFVDEASARIDVKISATLMEKVLGMKLENRPQSIGSFASNLRGFEQVRDFIASGTVTALVDLPF